MMSTELKCAVLPAMMMLVLALLVTPSVAMDQWTIQLSDTSLTPYTNFEVDEDISKVVVITVNSLYHLSMDLSTQSNVKSDTLSDENFDFCFLEELRIKQECSDIHRVLAFPQGDWQITTNSGASVNVSDTVIVCGSNAFVPQCHYRNRSTLDSLKEVSGILFNPYGPSDPVPTVWTSTGRLVVAMPQDPSYQRYGISMSTTPFSGELAVRTRTNQRVFFNNAPNFVSLFERGDYLYLFFREQAVEHLTERVIYSRVARVCKNDSGEIFDEQNIFTTFLKARMSCSVQSSSNSKEITYYYNDLYGTYYHASTSTLYAVFQSPQNGPMGSVACMYTFGENSNDLEEVFNGKYLVEVGEDQFEVENNFDPFTCSDERSAREAVRVQLMEPTAMQSPSGLLFQLQGHAFQQILMIHINDRTDMLFIAAKRESDNALLLLKVALTRDGVHQLVDTIVLPTTANSSLAVNKLRLVGTGSTAHIYVGTESDIYRIPVQSCSTFTSCCSCLASNDPYCVYDKSTTSCVPSDTNMAALMSDVTQQNSSLCLVETQAKATVVSTSDAPPATTPRKCPTIMPPSTPGSGSVTNTVNEMVTLNPQGPEVAALSPTGTFTDYSWVIVGTVVGFIGGVVVGVFVVALYRRCGQGHSKRNKRMTHEIHNETESGMNPSTSNTSKKALTSVSGSGGRHCNGTTSSTNQTKQDINNSMEMFTNSNMLTRSVNEYTPHVPVHLRESSGMQEPDPHDPPVKPTLCTPSKTQDTTTTTEAATSSKCPDTPSKSSKCPDTPSKTAGLLATPTYKSQEAKFVFPPLYVGGKDSSPDSSVSAYSRTSSRSSAYTCSSPYRHSQDSSYHHHHQVNPDPNYRQSYKAEIPLTSQQKQVYGRNILARAPSIDGSKSKYINVHEHSNGVVRNLNHSYPSGSLPRQPTRNRREVFQIDAELGSSQC